MWIKADEQDYCFPMFSMLYIIRYATMYIHCVYVINTKAIHTIIITRQGHSDKLHHRSGFVCWSTINDEYVADCTTVYHDGEVPAHGICRLRASALAKEGLGRKICRCDSCLLCFRQKYGSRCLTWYLVPWPHWQDFWRCYCQKHSTKNCAIRWLKLRHSEGEWQLSVKLIYSIKKASK